MSHTSDTALDRRAAAASAAEADCREFAAEYGHLPNVVRAMRYAESGRIAWAELSDLFKRALATGIEAVR